MSKEYIIENYEVTNLQDYVTPAKKYYLLIKISNPSFRPLMICSYIRSIWHSCTIPIFHIGINSSSIA